MFYLLDLCFLTFVDSRHNNKGVLKELIKIVLLDSLKDIDDGVIFRGACSLPISIHQLGKISLDAENY